MTCKWVRNELSSLLDGELDAEVARDVRTHLDDCAGCRAELETLGRLSAALAVRLEPDPGFIVRFRERRDRLRTDIAEWWFWRRLALRLVPLAAAAIIGAIGGFQMTAPSHSIWEHAALVELEAIEWGSDQAFASEQMLPQPMLRIAIEPFPAVEP